jgi:hypothetical protein
MGLSIGTKMKFCSCWARVAELGFDPVDCALQAAISLEKPFASVDRYNA